VEIGAGVVAIPSAGVTRTLAVKLTKAAQRAMRRSRKPVKISLLIAAFAEGRSPQAVKREILLQR